MTEVAPCWHWQAMQPCRLHITGASGSGTTTLGRTLASLWSVPFHDTDDYFWQPTVPPYTDKRPEAERLDLMWRLFVPRDAWVLTGSLMGWGDPLTSQFDAVVFLYLDPTVRLRRLKEREARRYGEQALAPGGAMHDSFGAFMDWATGYDDPAFTGRSLARHEEWLANLPCQVLRLDSNRPLETLVASVTSA